MKLKTLLLGSAASLMAVTGAQAADAVVEDEAVEYVRVCETFGTGYFFIPGTETCIKLSGDVRIDYAYDDFDNDVAEVTDFATPAGVGAVIGGDGGDGRWRTRGRVEVSTASETDLGTVTTFTRLQGSSDSGVAGPVFVDQAIIGIEGFSAGFGDNYWSRNIGFGLVGGITDGLYGYDNANYAEYTYEVAGFAVTGGLEVARGEGAFGFRDPEEDVALYAGVNYGASFGSIGATLYYDFASDHIGPNATAFYGVGDNGFAYNIGVQLKPIEGLNIEAFYTGGEGYYIFNAGGFDADYTYGVGAGYTFGDVTPYVLYTATDGSNADYLSVGAYWTPSGTGLTFQAEATFFDSGTLTASNGNVIVNNIDNRYSLRLRRAF